MKSDIAKEKIYPNFQSPQFLREHIEKTFQFYHPRCIDSQGGFYQFFKDNGDIYDDHTRHLVSSTRFVFNYAMASMEFDKPQYLAQVQHGLEFIETQHHNASTQGYAWLLKGEAIQYATNHCYGLAFVLLSYAVGLKPGAEHVKPAIEQTWNQLEARFWDAEHQLYKDEYNADFSELSPYRGQNANMHLCEALLTSFEATQEQKYLDRAYILATRMTQDQAQLADGLIWEHYTSDWEIDWDYNRDNPKHLFSPWGFQAGHQTE